MPIRRSRDKPSRWIFRERARPVADGTYKVDAQDGRPALDERHGDNADRLLDRLREVHGGQGRPDLVDASRARF
jgi:hypothetical protein